MKSYCWDNKGKEETEKQEFIKKYAEWIENPRQGECPYSDPDAVSSHNYEFYGEITEFLQDQKQQKKYSNCFDAGWEFEKPESKKKYIEDRAITLKKNKDAYLYLTSDQFGFSAVKKYEKENEKYPFVKYVKHFDGCKSLVGNTVWYTTTIGGSFLWPKVKCDRNWQSSYNLYRGVDSYIEDRVDLTLYEIKEFYDEYSVEKDYEKIKDKLSEKGSNLLKYSDAEYIYKWISIFKCFNTYVDFFCFNSFVKEEKDGLYYPRDIFTGKSIKENDIKKYRDNKGEKYKFIQKKASKGDLEDAFNNLMEWTCLRSENIINLGNKQ